MCWLVIGLGIYLGLGIVSGFIVFWLLSTLTAPVWFRWVGGILTCFLWPISMLIYFILRLRE